MIRITNCKFILLIIFILFIIACNSDDDKSEQSDTNLTCSNGISPTSNSFDSDDGSGYVSVSAKSVCNWAASSNSDWITVTSGSSGTGNGTVRYSVSENTGSGSRTGAISIAGKIFTVNQDGVTCSNGISPTSNSFDSGNGSGYVSVSAKSVCNWVASSNSDWITVTSGSSGTGNGTVRYSVSENTGSGSRTGTISIAGKIFTVNQDGVTCSNGISPTSNSFDSGDGSGYVSVSAKSVCNWVASSNSDWITVTFGSSGTGNGSVRYSVSENTGSGSRTGTISIAGKIFTVNQDGTVEDDTEALYLNADFPIGVAVDIKKLNTSPYRERLIKHFNSVTAENYMKMHRVYTGINEWNFEYADDLVDFCKKYNKKLHGHNLVWPEHVPKWVADWTKNNTKDALKEYIYKTYIQKMMSRFNDDFITGWDVVNDAFDKNGDSQPLKINGESTYVTDKYGNQITFDIHDIADFFNWARKANPNAKLYFNESFSAQWRVYKNDYDLPKYEFLENKKNFVLSMIDYFKNHNVPIDGIGLQMHISFNEDEPAFELVKDFVKEIYERGLSVRFSEVDISMNTAPEINNYTEGSLPSNEMLMRQKNRVYSMVILYKTIPHFYREGITFWGLSDIDCWISRPSDSSAEYYRVDWPVLFDYNYSPKPSFYGFIEALDSI